MFHWYVFITVYVPDSGELRAYFMHVCVLKSLRLSLDHSHSFNKNLLKDYHVPGYRDGQEWCGFEGKQANT